MLKLTFFWFSIHLAAINLWLLSESLTNWLWEFMFVSQCFSRGMRFWSCLLYHFCWCHSFVLRIFFFKHRQFFFFKMFLVFLKYFIYLLLERGEGREEDREKNQHVRDTWLPLACPLLGTWPTTQANALTGNQTATFQFTGWCSIHWATPIKAVLKLLI